MEREFIKHCPNGGNVRDIEAGYWRLEMPAGPKGTYRGAQIDDYTHLARQKFPYQAPVRLELQARVSSEDLPGTWGFGFWNDPFNATLGIGGTENRLPALPNTAWFFYASKPNYLAFRDDHPAQGLLAATFSAPRIPSLMLAGPSMAVAPLVLIHPTARLIRRAVRLLVKEDAAQVSTDVTQWHTYRLDWIKEEVRFWIDGEQTFKTPISPKGPMGFVLWIDNQYAAFPPDGNLKTGNLPVPLPAWLEVKDILLKPLSA